MDFFYKESKFKKKYFFVGRRGAGGWLRGGAKTKIMGGGERGLGGGG